MKSIKYWLAGLLLIQIAVIAGILWNKQQLADNHQTHNLINAEHNQIDQLVITDADKNTVTLLKSGGNWQLPTLDKLPADESKLENLLLKLQALKASWPAAATSAAQQRFEVAKDNFQRRVQLFQNQSQTDEIYVGTSPGFRKVHIRKAAENEIYAVVLNTFDLPAKATDWLDKTLLAIPDMTTVKAAGSQLYKKDEQWLLTAADGSEQVIEPEQADKLVTALAQLKVESILEQVTPAVPTTKTFSLEGVNYNGGWTLHFAQTDDQYTVKRNDREQVFQLAQTSYEQIEKAWQAVLSATQNTADEESLDQAN